MQTQTPGKPSRLSAFQAFVSGRVQGVGYRDFTWREARRLGVVGYVRNLPDGRVEVWAEGRDESLEAFGVALRQGPRAARVEAVEIRPVAACGQYHDFEIRYF